MNQIDFKIPEEKFKHFNSKQLDFIIRKYDDFITATRVEFRIVNN